MIGDNIRTLMQKNGYTQKELAIRSQCSAWAISRYVNNVHIPGIRVMQRLAVALGVTVDELRNNNFQERRAPR